MKDSPKPAFYALAPGGWRDYVTLLHLPYTAWHLSYVVIGASTASVMHWDRLGWSVLAFFLAVGLGAHALDELKGRPLGTNITRTPLIGIAACSILGATAIGVLAISLINLWVVPFILFGGFIVVAYNLELGKGVFHSYIWFGLGWGAFPALAGYWANAERLDIQAVLIAAGCFTLSLTQWALSNRVKDLRRNAQSATGSVEFSEGRIEEVTISYLLAAPELELRLLSLSVCLLAVGLLVTHL